MDKYDLKEKFLGCDDKAFDLLVKLKQRWEDEEGLEDIGEYLKVIQKRFPYLKAYAITQKPFGIKCKANDGDIYIIIRIRYNRYKAHIEDIPKGGK